jgi:ADP-ribose pyrophosphatase
MSDEAIRVYLARELSAVPRAPGQDEEAGIEIVAVPLAEAVAQVFAGSITNGMACMGVLAAAAWCRGDTALRAADAPWPDRGGR